MTRHRPQEGRTRILFIFLDGVGLAEAGVWTYALYELIPVAASR